MKHHAHVLVLHLRKRQQLRSGRVLERLAPLPGSRLVGPQNGLESSLQRGVGEPIYAESPPRPVPTVDRIAVVHSQRRAEAQIYASRSRAEATKRVGGLRRQGGVEKRGEGEHEAGAAPVEGNRRQLRRGAELDEIPVGKGGLEGLRNTGGAKGTLVRASRGVEGVTNVETSVSERRKTR